MLLLWYVSKRLFPPMSILFISPACLTTPYRPILEKYQQHFYGILKFLPFIQLFSFPVTS
uniref:Uncharacterized protein n=1 Tax=Octopus bimaculoides TaxID=37653 RepID=A0A0L8GWE6_OCTBM